MHSLVEKIEKKYMKKKVCNFSVGDQVKVSIKIVEGEKERVQSYQGSVVGIKGKGISETFTVSRISFGYANEKVFQLHSPNIISIEVIGKGIVRRSKINYIRGKLGKAAKIAMQVGKQVTAEQRICVEEEKKPSTEKAEEEK